MSCCFVTDDANICVDRAAVSCDNYGSGICSNRNFSLKYCRKYCDLCPSGGEMFVVMWHAIIVAFGDLVQFLAYYLSVFDNNAFFVLS